MPNTPTKLFPPSRSGLIWSGFTALALAAMAVLIRPLVLDGQTPVPPTPAAAAPNAVDAATAPAIDPNADRILKAACKYLADAKAFTVKAEIWQDAVVPSGQKIQTTKAVEIHERRPGQLHIDVHSPRLSRGFWYKNKTLTMLDRANNLYGTMDVPETIDQAIDAVEDRFGVQIPLADILVADPYRNVMDVATGADDLGKATVLGVVCRHLAFTSDTVDCQIWIAEGPKPLPRKIVLNHKTQVGSPQITAIFTDWDLVTPIADSVFSFDPPEGSHKIEVQPKAKDVSTSPTPKP